MIGMMHILVAAANQSVSQSRKGRHDATHLDQERAGERDENGLRFGPMSDVDPCAGVRREE